MRRDQPAGLLDAADVTTSLSVRVPVELDAWLRERARQLNVSVATIVRGAISAERLAVELVEQGADV